MTKHVSPSSVLQRPKGLSSIRRVDLPNGKEMLVVREATFQDAVKAGEASLRQSRLSKSSSTSK